MYQVSFILAVAIPLFGLSWRASSALFLLRHFLVELRLWQKMYFIDLDRYGGPFHTQVALERAHLRYGWNRRRS